MSEYVPVPVECRCDPPHGAEVFLLPRLTYDGGAAASAVLNRFIRSLKDEKGEPRAMTDEEQDDLGTRLGRSYLQHQAVGWTCDKPFDKAELLSDWSIAKLVAEKADELYSDAVLAPLVKAVAKLSPVGPTARRTSRRKPSTSPSPTP